MSYFDYEPEFLTDDPGFLRLKPEAAYLFTLLVHRMMRHGHIAPDKEFYRILWGIRFSNFTKAWDQATSVIPRDHEGFMWVEWVDDMRSATEASLKSDRERKRSARMARRESTVSAGLPPDVRGTSDGRPRGRTDGRTDGQTPELPEDKPRPAKKSPTGPQAECYDHWQSEWSRVRDGAKFLGARKDFVAIAELLKVSTPEEVKRRMTLMLTDNDPWIMKNASPSILRSKWNTYDGIPSRPSGTTRIGSADYLPEIDQ